MRVCVLAHFRSLRVARGLNAALSACFAALVAGVAFRTFFLFPARVPTASMEPALAAGSWILIDRFTLQWRSPKRGEPIVFLGPDGVPGMDSGTFYVKRLVGLPGELIGIADDGSLRVNGQVWPPNSPGLVQIGSPSSRTSGAVKGTRRYSHGGHLRSAGFDPETSRRIPDGQTDLRSGRGEMVVFGDNTTMSYDSRAWGPLDRSRVEGLARALRAD